MIKNAKHIELNYKYIVLKVLKDNTNADYADAKRVCKDFEIKNLGEYQDLYVESDTLLLADVLGTLEIRVLKYTNLILKISFSTRISMASSFKNDVCKIISFSWYRYVFMVEKGITAGICHSIYRYIKANNK